MSTQTVARAVSVILLGACASDATGPAALPPVIDAVSMAANEHNVLSAYVTVSARHADSALVTYRLVDDAAARDINTPAVAVIDEAATIPLLGLLPDKRYAMTLIVYGAGGATLGGAFDLTSGTLPTDLPQFTTRGGAPSPGYVLLASGAYIVVIDNAGRVVWYRRFPNGAGLNVMAQPNGHYAVQPPTLESGDVEPWLELDPLGNVTRTLACANDLRSRLHDLIVHEDGSYRILCDEVRTMNLASVGGHPSARVVGTAVQHVSPSGGLLSEWSAFDHFSITDLDPGARSGAEVNWTHGNALDLDEDGNLLVSFRSLGEITKIDGETGEVIWRLGGRRNEFQLFNTPMPAFVRQHGARWAAPGVLVLLDNQGNPVESRAERYLIDEMTRTAVLTSSYGSAPGVMTEIGGSVQPLGGGRMLVSFGTAGRIEEYDASGRMVWRIDGNPGYVFRAQRIRSLYAPGVGTTR